MMDYYLLADFAAQIGYRLAMAGAETFRVEDTIRRVLHAYGLECEVFAIPNSLTVSFEAANGKPLTILKRIGYHGNDLEALEQLNALSRRICREKPDVETAVLWLKETVARCRVYRLSVSLLGSFLGGADFCLVFGGTLQDCLWAGMMGLIIGCVNRFMDRLEANPFFSTITASFLMALPAYLAAGFGWLDNPDAAIIGALMILVPGLLITNSMRTSSTATPTPVSCASCRYFCRPLPSRWVRRRPDVSPLRFTASLRWWSPPRWCGPRGRRHWRYSSGATASPSCSISTASGWCCASSAAQPPG